MVCVYKVSHCQRIIAIYLASSPHSMITCIKLTCYIVQDYYLYSNSQVLICTLDRNMYTYVTTFSAGLLYRASKLHWYYLKYICFLESEFIKKDFK